MIGKAIGNYTVVARLGAGGMGEVYRARDGRLDRDVAIKVLPEAFAADAERLARFEREAKLLAGLNHPNIGSIFGIEEAEGATVLVLELVEGEDLSQRIARGPIPVDEAVEIARQVAEALETAHEQGIIHRDLKPANIVLSGDGRAKVLDFGLAKALGTEPEPSDTQLSNSPTALGSSPTLAGVILGTAAYMSPEQARGKPVDKRADVFAFGAVVWEMLTGRQLFVGDTVSDTLAAVLRATPDFDDLPGDAPPALVRLLRRCLEKDARQRLRDIGEARIALERIEAGELGVAEARTPGVLSRLAPYTGWIVTGILVVVMILLMQRGGGSGESAVSAGVELPLRKSTIDMSPDDVSITDAFAPQLSPDGRYIAYMSGSRIWVRDLAAPDAHPLAETEGATKPFWSPDSRHIAFGRRSRIERIPREGGRPVVIGAFEGGTSMAGSASGTWNENDLIVVSTAMGGLYQMPARGGEITTLLSPAEGETDFHQVGLLPGGRGWLFVVHDSSGIGRIDAVTTDGARHPVIDVDDSVNKPEWSPSGHVVFGRSGVAAGIWAVPFSLERMEPTGAPFLVAAGGRRPSVSGDGTLVYARGIATGLGRLTWLDREGEVLGTVGPVVESTRPFPRLSGDDRFVIMSEVFGDSRELFLYDTANDNRRRITFNELREDIAGFHPNGHDVYFYETNTFTTHIRPLDGSGDERVIANMIMPEFTADGSTIVGSRQKGAEWVWELHAVSAADPDESTRLVGTGGVDWWPALSPDGRFLAYMSDDTGQDEVYITTFPDAATRWQASVDGGSFPAWRADGGELFYTAGTHIVAVPVEIGKGLTLGTPRTLFAVRSTNWSGRWPDGFDVSADGQRFIVLQPRHGESDIMPSIVVVQNWFAEF